MAVEPPRSKVLIPEKVSRDGLNLLQKTLDVHEKKGLSAKQLLEIIGELPLLSDIPEQSNAYFLSFSR
jgi:hypothetical protein